MPHLQSPHFRLVPPCRRAPRRPDSPSLASIHPGSPRLASSRLTMRCLATLTFSLATRVCTSRYFLSHTRDLSFSYTLEAQHN